VYKLNQIITEHDLTICAQKTKLMAFKGRDPVRCKTVIENKIIEQVNSFYYLGNLIPYEKEVDICIASNVIVHSHYVTQTDTKWNRVMIMLLVYFQRS